MGHNHPPNRRSSTQFNPTTIKGISFRPGSKGNALAKFWMAVPLGFLNHVYWPWRLTISLGKRRREGLSGFGPWATQGAAIRAKICLWVGEGQTGGRLDGRVKWSSSCVMAVNLAGGQGKS